MNKKIIIIMSILLVTTIFSVGVITFLSQVNKPVVAVLNVGQGTRDQTDYQIDLTPKLVTGKYVSYDYPVGLTPKPEQIAGIVVEDFIFVTRDVESWTLAIDVSNLRTGKLTESSSYTVRKSNPATYTEGHMIIKGQSIDNLYKHE